jgi:hypothetical protein
MRMRRSNLSSACELACLRWKGVIGCVGTAESLFRCARCLRCRGLTVLWRWRLCLMRAIISRLVY